MHCELFYSLCKWNNNDKIRTKESTYTTTTRIRERCFFNALHLVYGNSVQNIQLHRSENQHKNKWKMNNEDDEIEKIDDG